MSSAAPLGESAAAALHRRGLVADMTFEIVPLKNLAGELDALPARAAVSVTCSPKKGIDATLDLCAELTAAGFATTPHVAARMVSSRAHVDEIADRCRSLALDRVFVIAGDAVTPGPYDGAVAFLEDFLAADPGVGHIGVAAYPDGHAFLSDAVVGEALRAKQRLLEAAGVAGWCSTQLCFDPRRIAEWLRSERDSGLTLPVHLGVAGVVDRTKLLTMGARLGVGDSLAFLRKNAGSTMKLLSRRTYQPDQLLVGLGDDLLTLGVDGLHVFTFNQLVATARWRSTVVGT